MQEIGTSSSASNLWLLPEFATAFASEILSTEDLRGDVTYVVKPVRIREMIRFLKTLERCPFNVMMDLFAMDYLKTAEEMPERFAVIYNLYSLPLTPTAAAGDTGPSNARVRLKAYVSEAKPEIDSIHDLYKAANWFEREAWDLYGVVFSGHPHLQRILCHNEFVGHPLRKDYPSDQYQRLKNPTRSAGL